MCGRDWSSDVCSSDLAAQTLLDLLEDGATQPSAPIRIGGQVQHRASLIAPRAADTDNVINLKGRNEI